MISWNRPHRTVKIMWLAALAAAWLSAGLSLSAAPKVETANQPAATAAPASASEPAFTPAAAEYRKLVLALCEDSMEGRGVGTDGLQKARDYILDQFKATGLSAAFAPASQPTSQQSDQPAAAQSDGQSTYFEPFSVRAGVKIGDAGLELLDKDGKTICKGKLGKDFAVLGFSGSGKFDESAVFAGYGIVDNQHKYDSYTGMKDGDLKGKIAIIYRYEPQNDKGKSLWASAGREWSSSAGLLAKFAQAAKQGAAAAIFVNPPSRKGDHLLNSQQTGFSTGEIPAIQVTYEFFLKMLQACGMDETRAQEFQTQADDGKLVPLTLAGMTVKGQATVSQTTADIFNVGCVLPGEGELAKEVVVVGGHYDHIGFIEKDGKKTIFYGADDNASGSSGVIMLARKFAELKKAGKLPSPRRTIVFVTFAGEELGLIGSNYLAGHLKDLSLKFDRISAMVNLDMIGRLRDNRLYLWGVDSGDLWRGMIDELARDTDWKFSMTGSGFGPSDHASFYGIKVPVISFCTGMHVDVHQPTDRPEKINFNGAVRVLELVEATINRLIDEKTRIAYQPSKARLGAQGRGYLGVMPDASGQADQKGCPISRVMPSGPAEAGGMKAGDVVIQIDQDDVGDTNGLLEAISKCKAGQKVKVVVLRAGKKVELEITLGGGN